MVKLALYYPKGPGNQLPGHESVSKGAKKRRRCNSKACFQSVFISFVPSCPDCVTI